MIRVPSIALSLALFAAAPAFSQTTISGDWDVTVNSPQGANTTLVTFKQDGEKISGVFRSPRGELPFEGGTLTGGELKFTFTITTQGMQLPITLTGKIEGETMAGKADFGGFAEGDWTAKRATGESAAALAAAASAAAAAAPASAPATTAAASASPGMAAGQWDVTFKTPGGDRAVTATLTQDNGKLSGTVATEAGEVPITGTIAGKSVTLSFTAQTPQGSLPITMTGDIDGEAVANGKAEIAGLGTMEWTAKRKQ
jgi:hypothetical protein